MEAPSQLLFYRALNNFFAARFPFNVIKYAFASLLINKLTYVCVCVSAF